MVTTGDDMAAIHHQDWSRWNQWCLTHCCPIYSLSLRDADMDVGGRALLGAAAERVGESEARGRG
jgi:hypothetical protein